MALRTSGPPRGRGARRGGSRGRGSARPSMIGRPRFGPPVAVVERPRTIELPPSISVKEMADLMSVNPVEVLKHLIKGGIMANINQVIDYEVATQIATEMGFEVTQAPRPEVEETGAPRDLGQLRKYVEAEREGLESRPPIVTIMGHVDHGKTSLLDAIRHTNVTEREAGGITQHIGAYQAELHNQKITFLDTPGHEAFTAMRARGAQVTDVAVLVVAADDGVMPQTVEAIDHARAAGVPIVVAINKIDKPNANVDRVKNELAELGLVPEEWGGETVMVPVSAKRREGIDALLEMILLVAEIQELRANPNRPAVGAVVEAKLDKNRGPVATLLVRTGTLRPSDFVVVGETYGRIKAMLNEHGKRLKKADPAAPVEVLGLNAVPQAGDTFEVVPDEKAARAKTEERLRLREAEAAGAHRGPRLEELFGEVQAGKIKDLNIILKTDVQGSIEPIRNSLTQLSAENVKVRVLHTGAGSITESDVMLAVASKAIIIGFTTRVEHGARRMADQEGVDIRMYQVIYELVDDVKKALTGLLEPKFVDVVEGHAEVRQVFKIARRDAIAGSYVTDGKITRSGQVRVLRGGQKLWEGRVASLKRFKDDVREVAAGYECGIAIEGFSDFEPGDVLEFYRKERAT
ncbi:MAG: translation initiation factor IF-2 [Chloroflexi bacterium]|nr:translation initiation factor IF-2 [Chloroflexota bacterium]